MMIGQKILLSAAAAATLASAFLVSADTASARGKEFFVEEYQVSKPLHGYSGHAGAYYCDYQRLPRRKCTYSASGQQSCRIVGWTVREMCQ